MIAMQPPRPHIRLYIAAIMAGLGLVAAALIPPAPGRGHMERARRANCMSNLKQLGLALAMYADDNNGRLPVDGDPPTLLGSLRLMERQMGSVKILRCPSDGQAWIGGATDMAGLTITNISYSYVPFLTWDETGGSSTIVMLDRLNATEKGSKWPVEANHGEKGGNVLFTDGHVEFVTELPVALRDGKGRALVLSP